MRLGTGDTVDEPLNSIIERLLNTADALVQKRTVGLPESVRVQAVIQVASFLYDMPLQASNAWIRSGAMDICRPWLRRRGGVLERE